MAPPFWNDDAAKSLANAKAKREALEEALKEALAAEKIAREKRAADEQLGVFMEMLEDDDDNNNSDGYEAAFGDDKGLDDKGLDNKGLDDNGLDDNGPEENKDDEDKGGDDKGGDDIDGDDTANILVVDKKPARPNSDFIEASSFVPGAFNVFLPGPWVTFWCADCGRKLASRSIHEHWRKAHGDKHNLAGLKNVANNAMSKFTKFKGEGNSDNSKKRAAVPVTPAHVGHASASEDAEDALSQIHEDHHDDDDDAKDHAQVGDEDSSSKENWEGASALWGTHPNACKESVFSLCRQHARCNRQGIHESDVDGHS